jgi:tetratricopeptide (TPR) repeat protein
VTGWLGDFFRFWWALFYWNTRKTWFRLRGAHRDECPCQAYSDSGKALDSRCEAVAHWREPARFRRVCPLLTRTPQGWRCGVDAESVRPFWDRALIHGAGLLTVLYLAGTLAVFLTLRLAGYQTDYLTVAWPSRWSELRASQEKLYATRAQRALQSGNYNDAILSLELVTRLNPKNYEAGLALANLNLAAGRPTVADHIYERLMRYVPDRRRPTAQLWFRTLLSRAAYDAIKPLATTMLNEDPADRAAWLNALLFASRQTADAAGLGTVLTEHLHLPEWCTELIGLERMLLQNHLSRALPGLTRIHRRPPSPYLPYYQIDRLLRHNVPEQAAELLRGYGGHVPADEAAFLRLRLYHLKGWTALTNTELDTLLSHGLSPRLIALFTAHQIQQPDPTAFTRFYTRLEAAALPVNAETLHLHHAAYLAALACGDSTRADQIAGRISRYTGSDNRALRGLGDLLKAPPSDSRLPRILPLVTLPTEVLYAILDRPAPPRR